MIRKRMLIVGLVLVVASIALAAFMLQPSAADLLTNSAEAMEQAMENLSSGHAIVEFSVDIPDQAGSGTVEVWGRMGAGPEGEPAFRAEVLSSSFPEAEGMIAVGDGSQFWIWDPAENRVLTGTAEEMRTHLEEKMAEQLPGEFAGEMPFAGEKPADGETADHPETPAEAVAKLLEYFTVEKAGSEPIGDSNASILRLIPIPEQMPDEVRAAGGLLHVWLRAEDDLPLGVAYMGGAFGEGLIQATTLELNVDLADELFTFEVPAGAEVMHLADLEHEARSFEDVDGAAEFDVLEPAQLVDGATLVEILEVRGAVVQRYNLADGGSFTIAQGRTEAAPMPDMDGTAVDVRNVTGMLFGDENDGRSLLTWQEGDLIFWVAGDLTAEQALNLANSLQ